MKSHIVKWGNSFGLRIPMQIIKKLQLRQGSLVTIEVKDGKIIIQPHKYNLEKMLDGITPENLHHQIFDNAQKENEAW